MQHWWINVGLAFPAALAIAFCSWRFIERPALSARKRIPAFEAAVVGWFEARRAGRPLQAVLGRVLSAVVIATGPLGTVLLVDGHETAGTVTIVVCFGAAVLAAGGLAWGFAPNPIRGQSSS